MSLIIATGSNLGDKSLHLKKAKVELSKIFDFVAESRVYESKAQDYLNQPDFYNQALEFSIPSMSAQATLERIMKLEKELGRQRDIPKGPRTVDIDIIFWGLEKIDTPDLQVPHPSLFQRSFVVRPVKELPFYNTLLQHFNFPEDFEQEALPV